MSEYSKRKPRPYDVDAWIQFKLLRLAAHHAETTKADLSVLAEIIQRYHGQYGNGYVSDAEICVLAGLNERTVRRARKNLTRLGFVQVVRAGGRGHATVYMPNFGTVPQMADIPVLDKKADIPVLLTDENVRLNGELPDIPTRPSSLRAGLQAGRLIERYDSAPPSAPAGAGLPAAPPGAAEEDLQALITAYCPADMSKPARQAYKRAWEALPPDTDRTMVIDAAADWHQSWAQQNNPDAPRMSLVRWLKDEMWLKPAPRGFNKVERPLKAKASRPEPNPPRVRKPRRRLGPTRIATTDVVTSGNVTELRFTTDTADEHVIVLEHPNAQRQEAGQRQLAALVNAAGLNQVEDGSDLHGRTVVITADSFIAPATRPDDEPPWPRAPEPEPRSVPTESAAAIAERMARRFDEPWPEWMSDDAA